GLQAFSKEPLTRCLGGEDVAVDLYSRLGSRTLVTNNVELASSPLIVSGKAEQFEEKRTPLYICWARSHLLIQLLNGRCEVCSLEQFFNRHRTSPTVPLARRCFQLYTIHAATAEDNGFPWYCMVLTLYHGQSARSGCRHLKWPRLDPVVHKTASCKVGVGE